MRPTTPHRPRLALATFAVVLVGAVLGLVDTAGAQIREYPQPPVIDVDKPIVPEGDIVTITGNGYLPNSVVAVCIMNPPADAQPNASLPPLPPGLDLGTAQSQLESAIQKCNELGGLVIGTTVSDPTGSWAFQWNTSTFPPGVFDIVATDGVNTLQVVVDITDPVPPGPDPGPGPGPAPKPLPQTGGIGQVPLRIGALLLAMGGLMVLASRNRHTART